ncbi:MAG: hypothetical protein WA215_01945 [Candidatus Cybelea sp.]
MRISSFCAVALSAYAAAALLAGCGGSQTPIGAPAASAVNATSGRQRFNYTGQRQAFTVPVGVKWLSVVALGARGFLVLVASTQASETETLAPSCARTRKGSGKCSRLLAWLLLYFNDDGMMYSPQISRRQQRIALDGVEYWLVRVPNRNGGVHLPKSRR